MTTDEFKKIFTEKAAAHNAALWDGKSKLDGAVGDLFPDDLEEYNQLTPEDQMKVIEDYMADPY